MVKQIMNDSMHNKINAEICELPFRNEEIIFVKYLSVHRKVVFALS